MKKRISFLAETLLLFSVVPQAALAESAVRPTLVVSNVAVAEGDSGSTPFTATITLTNNYYVTLPLTVRVTATPVTASERDYVFTATDVVLDTAGGTKTVSGFVVGDLDPENDETFALTATPLANDGGYLSYVYCMAGTVTIKDDDQARASRLHAAGVTILEGDAGTKQAEVRVSLEPASTSDVKVKYQSQDGTASAKLDYQPASGTLSFAPGEVLKTIVVDIIGDTVLEPDETFSIVLSEPSMALLGTARADVVIVNDDVASVPPDALPPTQGVDPGPDGGAGEGRPDAREDSKAVDLGAMPNGFDAKPYDSDTAANDVRASTANDSGPVFAGNDSGAPSFMPGNDGSAGGDRTALGGDCSCSVGSAGRPAGMAMVLGAFVAVLLARSRRRR